MPAWKGRIYKLVGYVFNWEDTHRTVIGAGVGLVVLRGAAAHH
jgi:hypothetical protein